MTDSPSALEVEALKLPADARARLAHRLLSSLPEGTEVDEAWFTDVARRVAAIEAGELSLVPAEEAIARVRQALS